MATLGNSPAPSSGGEAGPGRGVDSPNASGGIDSQPQHADDRNIFNKAGSSASRHPYVEPVEKPFPDINSSDFTANVADATLESDAPPLISRRALLQAGGIAIGVAAGYVILNNFADSWRRHMPHLTPSAPEPEHPAEKLPTVNIEKFKPLFEGIADLSPAEQTARRREIVELSVAEVKSLPLDLRAQWEIYWRLEKQHTETAAIYGRIGRDDLQNHRQVAERLIMQWKGAMASALAHMINNSPDKKTFDERDFLAYGSALTGILTGDGRQFPAAMIAGEIGGPSMSLDIARLSALGYVPTFALLPGTDVRFARAGNGGYTLSATGAAVGPDYDPKHADTAIFGQKCTFSYNIVPTTNLGPDGISEVRGDGSSFLYTLQGDVQPIA